MNPLIGSIPDLVLVLAGIRREQRRPERQAAPLRGPLLCQVLAALGTSPTDLRDKALLATLYTFALRRSEAAALDWVRLGNGRGWLPIEGNQAQLGLLGSKASAETGERVLVPVRNSPRTWRAIRRWIEHAGIGPGTPLFRPLTKSGRVRAQRLHADSIAPLIKGAMLRYFLTEGRTLEDAEARAQRYSGHSARVGFYVTATEAGVLPQHIAALARHRGLGMARRYSKQADMLKCAPHARKGVGV